MKTKTNINLVDSFAGVNFSCGKTLGRGTQVARIDISEKVCVGDKLTTTIFLN